MSDDRTAGSVDPGLDLPSLPMPGALRRRVREARRRVLAWLYDREAAAEERVASLPGCQFRGCERAAHYRLPERGLRSSFCVEHFPSPLRHDIPSRRLRPT